MNDEHYYLTVHNADYWREQIKDFGHPVEVRGGPYNIYDFLVFESEEDMLAFKLKYARGTPS